MGAVYRCYLTKRGRILQREELGETSLDDAIAKARRLLAEQPTDGGFDGFEIWHAANFLHTSASEATPVPPRTANNPSSSLYRY